MILCSIFSTMLKDIEFHILDIRYTEFLITNKSHNRILEMLKYNSFKKMNYIIF